MDPLFPRSSSAVLVALALACTAVGCKTALPPKDLLDAREEYARVAAGLPGKLAPADVHLAKESLDAADKSFLDTGDSPETRDKAYVAMRKAQLADVIAATKQQDQHRADLQRDAQLATAAELSNARAQLSTVTQRAAMTEAQLAQERQARIDAEKRAKEALENLAKMASIKQESRGMVITLSGAVLFPSGQDALLPAAMSSLDNVATALKSTPDRNITVEGHTDSVGSHAFNMDLSLRRAQSVAVTSSARESLPRRSGPWAWVQIARSRRMARRTVGPTTGAWRSSSPRRSTSRGEGARVTGPRPSRPSRAHLPAPCSRRSPCRSRSHPRDRRTPRR
jgi:outer membrane protein OmpA-like peptidoglycan-associated protein